MSVPHDQSSHKNQDQAESCKKQRPPIEENNCLEIERDAEPDEYGPTDQCSNYSSTNGPALFPFFSLLAFLCLLPLLLVSLLPSPLPVRSTIVIWRRLLGAGWRQSSAGRRYINRSTAPGTEGSARRQARFRSYGSTPCQS